MRYNRSYHPFQDIQSDKHKLICIRKLRFGVPVKELGDHRFDDVMKLLHICVEHAAEPGISKYLTWVVPEQQYEPATLEIFFENC
jgi:hypothetical protein